MKYRFKETGKVYELSLGGFVNAEIPKYKRFRSFHISSIDFTDFFDPVPDFKEGMWIKYRDGDRIWMEGHPTQVFRIGRINSEYLCVSPDFWNIYPRAISQVSRFAPATEKEIKNHLIREAEARGFVSGVKYQAKNIYGILLQDIRMIKNKPANFEYSPEKDVLFDNDYAIYVAGVWSEVIKAPKTIVVDGHELEIVTYPSAPHIKIGGRCYNLYEIRSIRNKMIEFSIESVKILGNLMTREDLAKIMWGLENAEN